MLLFTLALGVSHFIPKHAQVVLTLSPKHTILCIAEFP